MLLALCLCLPVGQPPRPAQDWIGTGRDCSFYCATDLNGDGFDDTFTVNGNHDLCVALNVNGWKSAGWQGVRGGCPESPVGLIAGDLLPDVAGKEIALVIRTGAEIYSRFADGKLNDTLKVAAPDGVEFASAGFEGTAPLCRDAKGKSWSLQGGTFAAVGAGAAADGLGRGGPGLGEASGKHGLEARATLGDGQSPPYDPDAPLIGRFTGDYNADGVADWAYVFRSSRPHEVHMLRVAMTPNPASNDRDSDGLADDEEQSLGSDPSDRDSDGDGLLDGWEVKGLPRGIELGSLVSLYKRDAPEDKRDGQLNPLRQDVIVNLSYFEGVDPEQFAKEMSKVQALYRAMTNANPDGSRGIWVHFRVLPGFVPKAEQGMPWWDIGNKYFPRAERGLMHWLQVTPWGGGQSSETGDMGGAGNGWQVFAHEFGHQMSLSHTGDSEPAWCPLYPSLMSYAFSYSFDGDGNAVHFSTGEFKDTALDERHLRESLPYPYASLKYLSNWPFRFTLKDNGDGTTLIDWNHNGKFDEGEVEADVNYGGSTYCGHRREHEAVGSAPALAYVGETCYLVAADQTKDHLWIKTYQGDEKWSDKRTIANSGTEKDPVVVGGKDFGLVFHHHLYGWHVTRFTEKELGSTVKIPDLPAVEMNACRVGDRVLLVSRAATDELEARWMTFKDNDFSKPVVSVPARLETRSLVTPGLGVDPADGRVLLVTSMHNSHGGVYSMRVTWMQARSDRLWEQEMKWTRGEGSGNGCCSRPVVAFTNSGQLNIFHQGGPDGGGQMIAYRTTRVGNAALDEGWLTCMLYDVWTRSRVPVGFANGPQGAIFGYRWDAGGAHVNWLATAHNGFGIDEKPMRDFDDGEKVSKWGIRHSILHMNPGR